MMRQVDERSLWIGNAGDLRDPRALFALGVEAVMELADNEAFVALPRELVRCRFPLSDGGDNPAWLLRLAADTLAALLKASAPTLVCCSGGMNRSVCIAAAGLSLAENRPFDEALMAVIVDGPADVSPALLAQVRAAIMDGA